MVLQQSAPREPRKHHDGIAGAKVPNAVVYWSVLVALALGGAAFYPFTITSSYLVSCGLLSAWRNRKGPTALYQPQHGAETTEWERRRWRSVGVSLVNCLIADLLVTKFVRSDPDLLYSFEAIPGPAQLAWVYISPLALLFIHDSWFYVCHRALHHFPMAYKWIHAMHHEHGAPEAWDLFYMHPVELVIAVAVPFLVTPRLLSLHWVIYEGLVLKGVLIDCYGHCGFDATPFHPFKLTQFSLWPRFPWRSVFLTAKHHDDHHRLRTGNYALYLCIWDDVLGTLVGANPATS